MIQCDICGSTDRSIMKRASVALIYTSRDEGAAEDRLFIFDICHDCYDKGYLKNTMKEATAKAIENAKRLFR